jgi:two-component system chemotaxis sensor kinase CheA
VAQPDQFQILPDDLPLFRDFLLEGDEHLESIESNLLKLTQGEAWDVMAVYRPYHTLKGIFGFMNLKGLTSLAHAAEALLEPYKTGQGKPTPAQVDLLFEAADVFRLQIAQIAEGIERSQFSLVETAEAEAKIRGSLAPSAAPAPSAKAAEAAAPAAEPEHPAEDAARAATAGADSMVKVRTDKLDKLIDMVGELVIAQSMVAQDNALAASGEYDLIRKVGQVSKILREFQSLSMGMRMVPMKALFQKMARVVHDLSSKTGKEVNFVTEGEDTEIDRNMVDALATPLIHLIRNCMDHGLETPSERLASGKKAAGTVSLRAYHEDSDVVIQVSDDGKGLNREKILAKAVLKGLVKADEKLRESDVTELIFSPGFSTADVVTDVSGRGVGMDAVRQSIEGLKGRVEVSSQLGRGSAFVLRLPLTLAITDGILLRVGQERYVVPTANIHITLKGEPDTVFTVAGAGEMVRFKGEMIPIFRLHQLFNVAGAVESLVDGLLVVVGEGRQRCALLVDELLGQQQVVTKNLGDGIGKISGVAGGAILGDGRVGLILDAQGVANLARLGQAQGTALQPA